MPNHEAKPDRFDYVYKNKKYISTEHRVQHQQTDDKPREGKITHVLLFNVEEIFK